MKLVSYNIRFGLGLDQRIDLERIAKTVQDADIIALQEVERFWKRSGMIDQPEILAGYLKNFYWVYCPAFDVDASERNPNGVIINRRRQFGPMLLSRWPIRSTRSIVFPKLGTIDQFNMDTGALECVIDTPSGPLRVYSIHLSAISSRDRLIQLDYLLQFHRNAHINGGAWTGEYATVDKTKDKTSYDQNWSNNEVLPSMPKEAIMMGDFNSDPDSSEYEKMVGSIDACRGRVRHLDRFVDGWLAAKARSGSRFTWSPDPVDSVLGGESIRRSGGLRLDYCFVDPCLSQKVEKSWINRDAKGSDHKPIWIKLNF